MPRTWQGVVYKPLIRNRDTNVYSITAFLYVRCKHEHAVVEHHQLSTTAVSQAQQHSAVNPHKQQSKYAPIRAPQRKQTELARASMSPSIHIVQLAVFSKRTKTSKSARPTKPSNHSQSIFRSWCGCAKGLPVELDIETRLFSARSPQKKSINDNDNDNDNYRYRTETRTFR